MKKYWGPYLWHIIHTIALNYPNKPNGMDIFKAKQLIHILAFIIPCFKCKTHYMTNITKYKPNVNSGKQFFKWSVLIHNLVNKHNKKHIMPLKRAFNLTDKSLSPDKIKKLIIYLKSESKNYNISSAALIKFIDIVTYFNNRPRIMHPEFNK